MASRTRFSSRRQPSGKLIGSRSRTPRNAKSAKAPPNASAEVGRGHRTAYVPLKHGSEAITERWSRTGRKGAAAAIEEQQPRPQVPRKRPAPVVSPTATRAVLYKIAKRLAIKGRSAMTKRQLFEAISTPAPDRVRARSR